MKKFLSLSFLLGFLLLPHSSFAVSEECRAGVGACPTPPNASVCTAPFVIESVGGCPAGTVWIGDAATGQCEAPSYSPSASCSGGTTSFYCETNTCYTPPVPGPPAVCSTADVSTGRSLPCCADDQIVVRDSGYPTGWKCEDKPVVSSGSSVWSVGGNDAYYDTGNVGVGDDSPSTSFNVVGNVRSSNEAAETNYTEMGHNGINAFLNAVGTGRLDFGHDGNPTMSLLDSGYVGIGTTSPLAPLHVVGPQNVSSGLGISGMGIIARGDGGGGFFVDNNSVAETTLASDNIGIRASGDNWGGQMWDKNDSGLVYLGRGHTGVEGHGNTAGGSFSDDDSSGNAFVGFGDKGIHSSGSEMGGYFFDSNSTGIASVGFGDVGIDASGSVSGGVFSDSDNTGTASLGVGDTGIQASGSASGGVFSDSDSSGTVTLAMGDRGIDARGDVLAGLFNNTANSNSVALADGVSGITASGNVFGGTFNNTGTPSNATLASANVGISATGNVTGGIFNSNTLSGSATLAGGNTGIQASGTSFGGYFSDSDNSGEAYLGILDAGIQAEGTAYGGYFNDSDSIDVETYISTGAYSVVANGPINIDETGTPAFYVTGTEALSYDGTDFSWGFGGSNNYFANEVAIGESPATSSAMLHVNGSSNTAVKGQSNSMGGHFRDDDNDTYAYLGWGNYGAYTNGQLRTTHTGDAMQASAGTGGLIVGSIVGSHIQIDGNEIMASVGASDGDLYLQQEGGGVRVNGLIVHTSDERLKEDIDNLNYGLSEILQLRPVSFNWRERENAQKSLGLIAQEVQPVLNEVVFDRASEDDPTLLGVNYVGLIPVLISAIQEQNAEIEALRNVVCELKPDADVCH